MMCRRKGRGGKTTTLESFRESAMALTRKKLMEFIIISLRRDSHHRSKYSCLKQFKKQNGKTIDDQLLPTPLALIQATVARMKLECHEEVLDHNKASLRGSKDLRSKMKTMVGICSMGSMLRLRPSVCPQAHCGKSRRQIYSGWYIAMSCTCSDPLGSRVCQRSQFV